MTEISISRMHFPVTALGPGQRLAIWLQGCSIRCQGCVSMDTWAAGPMTTVDNLVRAAMPALQAADGVTVSGGEPFDQADALRVLLSRLRAVTAADILVYSGYPLEHLKGLLKTFDGLIDCVIADPYDQRSAQTLSLRGSDNQRLVCLTPLGRDRLGPYTEKPMPAQRSLDMMMDDMTGEVFFAGIPRPGDFHRLAALLEAQGHGVTVTADRRLDV